MDGAPVRRAGDRAGGGGRGGAVRLRKRRPRPPVRPPPRPSPTLVAPPVLGLPGGLPVRDDGRLVAGLGVGGVDPRSAARSPRPRPWHQAVTRRPDPVRVAVIGCGAIGSLYAAHLARVPGGRGLGRRPLGRAHGRDRQRTGCGSPGWPTSPPPVHARTDGRDLPDCDFGLVATKAPHTRAAVAGARRGPRQRGRRQPAERPRQRGGHRRAGAARHPRQHHHRRRGHRARRGQLRRARRLLVRPVRAPPGGDATRSSGSPGCSPTAVSPPTR